MKDYIGYLVGGGLKENLNVRLTVPSNEVHEGAFTVIESGSWQFYGLVTDLRLGATDPRFADEQSEERFPPGLAKLLHGQTLYTNLEVLGKYGCCCCCCSGVSTSTVGCRTGSGCSVADGCQR